jgi:hypothetical protein
MADKVRMWFDKQQIGGAVNNKNIDLAPDGKRMMALLPIEDKGAPEAQNHVVVLINFFDGCAKCPSGNSATRRNGGSNSLEICCSDSVCMVGYSEKGTFPNAKRKGNDISEYR